MERKRKMISFGRAGSGGSEHMGHGCGCQSFQSCFENSKYDHSVPVVTALSSSLYFKFNSVLVLMIPSHAPYLIYCDPRLPFSSHFLFFIFKTYHKIQYIKNSSSPKNCMYLLILLKYLKLYPFDSVSKKHF